MKVEDSIIMQTIKDHYPSELSNDQIIQKFLLVRQVLDNIDLPGFQDLDILTIATKSTQNQVTNA